MSGQPCTGDLGFNRFNAPAGLWLPGVEGPCGQDEKGAPVVVSQHTGIGIGFNLDAVGNAAPLEHPQNTGMVFR